MFICVCLCPHLSSGSFSSVWSSEPKRKLWLWSAVPSCLANYSRHHGVVVQERPRQVQGSRRRWNPQQAVGGGAQTAGDGPRGNGPRGQDLMRVGGAPVLFSGREFLWQRDLLKKITGKIIWYPWSDLQEVERWRQIKGKGIHHRIYSSWNTSNVTYSNPRVDFSFVPSNYTSQSPVSVVWGNNLKG